MSDNRKVKEAVMEIQAQHPANKQCFDCELPGPGYLDMTRGCFICQVCYMRLICKKIKKTMSRLYRWMILGINSTLHNPIILKSIAIDTLKWSDVDKLRSRGRCFIQNLFPSKLSIWQVMLGAQRTPQVQWEATTAGSVHLSVDLNTCLDTLLRYQWVPPRPPRLLITASSASR